MPDPSRAVKQVIDQAIKENRFGERLLYAFTAVLVSAGIFALIMGVIRNEGIIALAGSITSTLLIPAMFFARGIRKENIALRMIEIPLSITESAEEAAKILNEFFKTTLIKDRAEPKHSEAKKHEVEEGK